MSGKSALTHLSRAENGLFYSTNYLIDLDAGIIVDVEAIPAHRSDEVNSTKVMIDRVEEHST